MHLQFQCNDWPLAIADGYRYSVKAVDRGDLLKTAKLTNPNVVTLFRHWDDGQQTYLPANAPWADWLDHSRLWINRYVDGTFLSQHAYWCDIMELYNEIIANSHTAEETAQRVAFARAAAWVWENEYRKIPELAHIRLAVGSAAVGNIIPREIAEVAVQYGYFLNYHPYSLWQRGVRWDGDWLNLSGLFAVMEERWGGNLKPLWALTEFNVFESAVTGWKAPECLNGDPVKLVSAIREVLRDVRQTAAFREGRLLMPNLYTTDGENPKGAFTTYNVTQPVLGQVMSAMREEWEIMPTETPVNPPQYLGMPLYSQRDPSWANMVIYPGYSMAGYGCAVTSCAIIAGLYEANRPGGTVTTPGLLLADLKAAGAFKANDDGELTMIDWTMVDDVRHDVIRFVSRNDWIKKPADLPELFAALEQGPVVLEVDFIPATSDFDQHFVVAYARRGDDDLWIVDPWDGFMGALSAKYAQAGWDLARSVYGYRLYLPVEQPEPEPMPKPVIDSGGPRLAYERVYNYVPASLPLEIRVAIYALAATNNQTVGPSADDAGLGPIVVDGDPAGVSGVLAAKRIVVWEDVDHNAARQKEWWDWYDLHYPGCEVTFANPYGL